MSDFFIYKNFKYPVLFLGAFLFAVVLYPVLVFESGNKENIYNFILYFVSFAIFFFSVLKIVNSNIRLWSVFGFTFFGALFLNTINASYKQFLKGPDDLYFLLIAPVFMIFILGFFDSFRVQRINVWSGARINVNAFYFFVLILYILLKMLIGWKVGFRFFNYGIGEVGDKYVVPGWSGASAILQWMLIIFIPYVKKRYVILSVFAIIIISGVLHVKRGDVVRVFCFLLIFYSYRAILNGRLSWKSFFYFVFLILFISFLFSYLGQFRLAARGSSSDAIIDFLGSRVDSVVFSWLYGYFAFNFEVLSLHYDATPSYDVFWFIKEVLGFDVAHESGTISISAFNASTFLFGHIRGFGDYYFLSVAFYAFLVGFLVCVIRALDFLGGYLFLCSIFCLMVFGDYLINRSIFFSIIFSIILFPLLRVPKKSRGNLKRS